MTPRLAPNQSDDMDTWLHTLPADRVLRLAGTECDQLAIALAHGADSLPAPLTIRLPAPDSAASVVQAVLAELESAAVAVFPAWLPQAEDITTPAGAGLAAVRAVAAAHAAQTAHFAPFLCDLAAVALSGIRLPPDRFIRQTRALGLARVLADAFHRAGLILLIDVPAELDSRQEQALAAACEWLADRARVGVWLTGAPLTSVDWLPSVTVTTAGTVRVPPVEDSGVVGKPHPRSSVEALLEAALSPHGWAAGRAWNQSYQSDPLTNPVRLDLLWQAERCVVEIDGPEHCQLVRFEADRQRDVRLQLAGYAVLRFTNARVQHDVAAVIHQIGTFLTTRRRESLEGQHHG